MFFLYEIPLQIERAIKRMTSKKPDELTVFEWFKKHVITSKLEPSIEHEELVSFSKINSALGVYFHLNANLNNSLQVIFAIIYDYYISFFLCTFNAI